MFSSIIPGNSDRAATTLSGQLIQVTPPRLFIMPSTNSVTFDSSASSAAACTDMDNRNPAMAAESNIPSFVGTLIFNSNRNSMIIELLTPYPLNAEVSI